jgi:hypothetical protein
MRPLIAIGAIAFLLFGTAIGAANIPAEPAGSDAIEHPVGIESPLVVVSSADGRGISLDCRFPFPERQAAQFKIHSEGPQDTMPSFTRLLAIPEGVECVVESVMCGESVLPLESVSIGMPAFARSVRVVPITFHSIPPGADKSPNAAPGGPGGESGSIQAMQVKIRFDRTPGRSLGLPSGSARAGRGAGPAYGVMPSRGTRHADGVVPANGAIPASFDRLYRDVIINYSGPLTETAPAPGTYLLICPDSASVIARLAPLIEWRSRMGYTVRLATTSEAGNTPEEMKAFIQSVYDSAAAPLEYVCLVGDAADSPYTIPTWQENLSGASGEGDYDYTLLAGDDLLSDVHIGRLSITSLAELETEVAKTIGYETHPLMDDPIWFKRACLVGDMSYSGLSCIQTQQWIKRKLQAIGFAEIDTVFGDHVYLVAQMRTALNRGESVFCYRGSSDFSGWTIPETLLMTNRWKLPFCVLTTCETGSFAKDQTCDSEAFLRAGTAADPVGGIGAIGVSTGHTHTRYNNCFQMGTLYGLTYGGQTTMGSALTRGKYELYLNYGEVDPTNVSIFSTWNNLMGDPAVDIFLDTPVPILVDAPSRISPGIETVSLLVHGTGGEPIADALVCIEKGNETHLTATTGPSGRVDFPVRTSTPGDLFVTVTKHNHAPFLGTIAVAESSVSRVFAARSVIDDDAVGSSIGNADGLIEPNETIELAVSFLNSGPDPVGGVGARLVSEDPYVLVIDGFRLLGDIASGDSAWTAPPFVFHVDPSCPNGRAIRFRLEIASGDDSWTSIVDARVVAADLNAIGCTISGDGVLDPGETEQLSILLENSGGVPAGEPRAVLSSRNRFIEIVDGQSTYPSIAPGEALEGPDTFTLRVRPDCYAGFIARLPISIALSDGSRDTAIVEIPIGRIASSDPTGPDAYGYLAYDETDLAYPDHPFYEWLELDPALGGGGGTEIILGDTGDEQDKSTVVDLPFPFRFYGSAFTRGTVCSNGWLAMGSTPLTDYRNWNLPSGAAIDNLIAVFWDELYQRPVSKCLQRFDPEHHRWILEWSRFRNRLGTVNDESFEVILYDPVFHPTSTGDGKILMQYRQVANCDMLDGYATVGIQNADHTSGLRYTYAGICPPGAARLQVGRSILFVPPARLTSFDLISPAPEDSIHTTTPVLRWHAASAEDPLDPVRYTCIWSRSPDFSESDSVCVASDTLYAFPGDVLDPRTTYFWRVLARAGESEIPCNPPEGWAFHVVDDNTPCRINVSAAPRGSDVLLSLVFPADISAGLCQIRKRQQEATWAQLVEIEMEPGGSAQYLDTNVSPGEETEYLFEIYANGRCIDRIGPLRLLIPLPQRTSLRVLPNPSAGLLDLSFSLRQKGNVVFRLYDLQGREQTRMESSGVPAGSHHQKFLACGPYNRPLPSGCYYLCLDTSAGEHCAVRCVIIR